jgi:hypothetical protein
MESVQSVLVVHEVYPSPNVRLNKDVINDGNGVAVVEPTNRIAVIKRLVRISFLKFKFFCF